VRTTSARSTGIAVNGRDRPGLLYDVTRALSRLQLRIHGARIATYGERAIDVFYVQDALGDKIEAPARLKRIRERLLEALAAPEAGVEKPEKKAKAPAKKPKNKAAAKKPAKKSTGRKTAAAPRGRPSAAE